MSTYIFTDNFDKSSQFVYSSRCRACEVPRYEELVLDQWYRIVLPTFLVQGGDGFVPFETCGRNHEVGYLDWVVLSKYMKKISPILTGRDRRVIFLDGNSS